MKYLSFQGILLFIILLSQTGCQVLIDEKLKEALYIRARTLEGTARFYQKEGEVDSSLNCYRRSLSIFSGLEKKPLRRKDTLYCRHISLVLGSMGWMYDSLHKYDTGIAYELKALKWAYKAHDRLLNLAIINYNIGYAYKAMGDSAGDSTARGMDDYRKGIKYILSACWEMDSLNYRTRATLDLYSYAAKMYMTLHDTSRGIFYDLKYTELSEALYPDRPKNYNSLSENKNTAHQKNSSNSKNTGNSITVNNTFPGIPTANGSHSESTSVTVENGVQTTITTINGKVVKRETKKIN